MIAFWRLCRFQSLISNLLGDNMLYVCTLWRSLCAVGLNNAFRNFRGMVRAPGGGSLAETAASTLFGRRAWSALRGLDTLYKVSSLANMLIFLRSGVYR